VWANDLVAGCCSVRELVVGDIVWTIENGGYREVVPKEGEDI